MIRSSLSWRGLVGMLRSGPVTIRGAVAMLVSPRRLTGPITNSVAPSLHVMLRPLPVDRGFPLHVASTTAIDPPPCPPRDGALDRVLGSRPSASSSVIQATHGVGARPKEGGAP